MDKKNLLLEQWKKAAELHQHNDNLNWQQFNYFLVLNGLLVTALGMIWRDDGSATTPAHLSQNMLSVLISLLGCVISAVWGLIQKRGQLYQNYRIEQAKKAEEDLRLADEQVLSLYAKGLNEQKLVDVPRWVKRYSVQNLILALALFATIVWAALALVFFL